MHHLRPAFPLAREVFITLWEREDGRLLPESRGLVFRTLTDSLMRQLPHLSSNRLLRLLHRFPPHPMYCLPALARCR
jgi:hypothetical protein